ncbi:MAG: sigma-70 family RNA polymerase sigma factor [Candidatus Eisenbacteria bacterium]|nr:sigma-70 family RNA polymerase sigma factor [Candidatus Eisenbacteria bacterium]
MAKPDFEEIVARYDRRLFNVMYGMTGDYHDALDLTEEAFIRAMKAWPGFRGDSDPFTWLYRIAVNVLKKEHKKSARRRELLREHVESDPPPGSEPSEGDRVVLKEERQALVRGAIAQLPEVFREAVTLRYIDELSYEGIAAAAGCSVGTVKSRLARGKSMLAEILRGKI